jgi:hypothetical protein
VEWSRSACGTKGTATGFALVTAEIIDDGDIAGSQRRNQNLLNNEACWIKPTLILLPLGAPPGNVGPVLLAGVQAFFKADALSLPKIISARSDDAAPTEWA